MIVVVAKLFLVDLSSIGTIARIASFLTVGAVAGDHRISSPRFRREATRRA